MVVVGVVGRNGYYTIGGTFVVGTVGRNGSSSVDVVGGGEATENVGASDQVLVDAWARVVTYHNHSQKRTESCQTSIQWHSDT